MQIKSIIAATILVSSCSPATDDKLPFAERVVGRLEDDGAVQRTVEIFAKENRLKLYQNHYQQNFGCSNIYRLTSEEFEIVVINPFGFNYEISAYSHGPQSDKGLGASLVESIADNLDSLPRTGPGNAALC